MKSKLSVAAVCCAMLITVTGNFGDRSVIEVQAPAQSTLTHAGATALVKSMFVGDIYFTTRDIISTDAGLPRESTPAKAELATLDQ